MTYRLGVDVGGTFTDLLMFDETSGKFWRHKTPSTPHDSSEGILTGVKAITEKAGITAADQPGPSNSSGDVVPVSRVRARWK